MASIAGLAAALTLIAWLAAPRAHAFVYWTDFGNADRTTIGRADADGSNINPNFITGADAPCGVAVDQNNLYWANYNSTGGPSSIGRSDLDGNNVNESFIGLTAPAVCGVAVDTGHLYWTATGHGSGGSVGQADLNGSNVNEAFIAAGNGPCGVAVNSTNLFWANNGNGTIGRSDRYGGSVNQSFITGASNSEPCGADANETYVYWANFNAGTIGRAQVNGSGANQSFITGADHPCGVAIDDAHIYWANFSQGTIGRADLDGNNVNQSFMSFAGNPCGVAVTHTLPPPPPPPPPPTPTKPFNEFGIKRVKKDRHAGTATFVLNLPGPGSVEVDGGGVEPLTAAAPAAGEFQVVVKPTGAAEKQRESTGSVKVRVTFTFTPAGDDLSAKTKWITLRK